MIGKHFVRSLVKERGFVKFQLNSYNELIDHGLQKIINEIGEINPEVSDLPSFKIKLGKIDFGMDKKTKKVTPSFKEASGWITNFYNSGYSPMEARLRNLTYSIPIYVEMIQVINEVEDPPKWVCIGELPVMVKSKLCPTSMLSEKELIDIGEDPDDPGGYFIVNGTERVLVLVEEIAPNRMILEKKPKGTSICSARVNSERSGFIQRHLIEMRNDGILTVSFANVHKIPLVVLLKALKLETDKDIINAISGDPEILEELSANIYNTEAKTVEEALNYIGQYMKVVPEYRVARAERILDRYLLPHIGQNPENRLEKALYLAKVAKKLINLHLGRIEEDDIDHYSNKRLRMAGDLLELVFRSILLGRWGLITRICYNYQKLAKRGKLPAIDSVVESNVLTKQLTSSLATGAWVGGRSGVSQRLERGNFIRTLSHLRNILSPLTTTQEHFEARELHLTHWGRVCPSETPEGPSIGLRKYLAILAEITPGLSDEENKAILESLAVKKGEE